MSAKDRVATLRRLLRKRLPQVVIEVDPPATPHGDWFIDLQVDGRTFVIEFRSSLGFGLSSTPSEGIGEGPDEFFQQEQDVVERLSELVRSKAKSAPQRVRLLQELREYMQVSQVAVAAKLKVRQPTISKIERREDMNLSTLRRYIRALGGELQVTARFPDGAVEIGAASKPLKPAARPVRARVPTRQAH